LYQNRGIHRLIYSVSQLKGEQTIAKGKGTKMKRGRELKAIKGRKENDNLGESD